MTNVVNTHTAYHRRNSVQVFYFELRSTISVSVLGSYSDTNIFW